MEQMLTHFVFQGHPVRPMWVDGEIYFVVTDVCKVLEIKNVSDAIGRLDPDGVALAEVIDSLGRKQNTAIANEPNLYRLIFRSDKPEAKAFQDWVYKEVLPSIRRTGKYETPKQRRLSPAPERGYHITSAAIQMSPEQERALVVEYVNRLWDTYGEAITANFLATSFVKRFSTDHALLRMNEAAREGLIEHFLTGHTKRYGGKFRPRQEA